LTPFSVQALSAGKRNQTVQNQSGQKTATADGASEPRNGGAIASSGIIGWTAWQTLGNSPAIVLFAHDAAELFPAFVIASRECQDWKSNSRGVCAGNELKLQNYHKDTKSTKAYSLCALCVFLVNSSLA
jgi:hypothetical protein